MASGWCANGIGSGDDPGRCASEDSCWREFKRVQSFHTMRQRAVAQVRKIIAIGLRVVAENIDVAVDGVCGGVGRPGQEYR